MKIKKRKRVKQATALALSAVMAMSGLPYVPYLGANVAYAATLENNIAANTGQSSNTEYIYGPASDSTNATTSGLGASDPVTPLGAVSQNSFTLKLAGTPGGTYSKVMYGSNYFQTRYAFGVPSDVSGNNDISPKLIYSGDQITDFTVNTSIASNIHQISGAQNGIPSTVSIPTALGGGNIEVRQTVSPSKDNEYIMVEYTVYNDSSHGTDFTIGNEADTALIGHDNNPIVVSGKQSSGYEGVHFHATGGEPGATNLGGGHVFSTLDVYTKLPTDKTVTMEKRDGSDPSRTSVWAGQWRANGYNSTHKTQTALFMFTGIEKSVLMQDGDSAAAFSAYFNLKPHETKTAKFAIATRQHVYYAAPQLTDAGLDTGYMATPVTKKTGADTAKSTIERVLDKTATDNGGQNKTLYIMMQGDEEIGKTIEIPNGYNVVIMSADYNTPQNLASTSPIYNSSGGATMLYSYGASVPKANSTTYTLKRKAGFDGPLFSVKNGGTVKFMDINLDGQNVVATKPMIDVENGGTLTLATKASITNANTSATEGMPAAINVAGGAKVDMYGSSIQNNTSGKKAGAVKLADSSADFTVSGTVNITGSKDAAGSNANVYLDGAAAASGAFIKTNSKGV